MTFLQAYTLATNATFLHQIQMSSLQQAHAVISESSSGHAAVDDKRHASAAATLADGGVAVSPKFAYGIASVGGFSAVVDDGNGANDAAIASAMVSKWNDFAGVTASDLASG